MSAMGAVGHPVSITPQTPPPFPHRMHNRLQASALPVANSALDLAVHSFPWKPLLYITRLDVAGFTPLVHVRAAIGVLSHMFL